MASCMQNNRDSKNYVNTIPGVVPSKVCYESLSDVFAKINEHIDKNIANENQKTVFQTRENLFKLLEMLAMDHQVISGQNNYLYIQNKKTNQIHKVLDATGGYGANLLGHKNKEIIKIAIESLENDAPNMIQGCMRHNALKLADKLSELLCLELEGENKFQTIFSNSGTEAVEAAIKFSYLKYFTKTNEIKIELEKSYNLLIKNFENLNLIEKKNALSSISHEFNFKIEEISELINIIRKQNNYILEQKPIILALKSAFHGKTLGSLSITYNEKYRNQFYLENPRTLFVRRNNTEELSHAFKSCTKEIIFPKIEDGTFCKFTKNIQTICASFIEPIQGEAGVYELNESYIQELYNLSKTHKTLLVADEIQSGCYRTQRLSALSFHLKKSADIYIFSKALGAGVAKIGATLINQKIYDNQFDLVHTSTFADDEYSSKVAFRALEILSTISLKDKVDIKIALEQLQAKYPKYIKEIRGRGLMLSLELNEDIKNHSYEFKFFYDMKHLGSLFASCLLNNEDLRINTTLSNQLSFRVQLSALYENEDVHKLISALDHFLSKIQEKDANYFFAHIFQNQIIEDFSPLRNLAQSHNTKKKAVFLNHPIKTTDLKEITKSFKNIEDSQLDEIIMNSFEFLKFEKYFTTVIKDDNADELEVIMLSIPIPSHLLKKIMHSKKNFLLQEKLQEAIKYAKDLGASVVGLGQFTSIISQNGLTLDSLGLNITTGNPFTAHLAISAFLEGLSRLKVKSDQINLACFGITGNIISQVAKKVSLDLDSLNIFHHENIQNSKKFRTVTIEFLNYLNCIEGKYPNKIKKALNEFNFKNVDNENLNDILVILNSIFRINADKTNLLNCNAILLGTNSSEILVHNDQVNTNTVILDLGVPHNLDPQLFLRDDIEVMLGGVAHLPKDNEEIKIEIPSFPLGYGEVFACMAETFATGFHDKKEIMHIGEVKLSDIDKIASIASNHGFGLKCSKVISSL